MNVWCQQTHTAKPRSSGGEGCFSEAAARGAGQRRKATRPNMQPAPRPKSPRTAGKQALPGPRPLARNENVRLPTTGLNGSSVAWLYIILRNYWLKTMDFLGHRAWGYCWRLSGGSQGCWERPEPSRCRHPIPRPSGQAGESCEQGLVGSVATWRRLRSNAPRVWTGFHCRRMNCWSGTVYVAVRTCNLFIISCWMMLYISLPSLFIFFSKVILFISSVVNFKLIFFFIFFPVQYLQWCCVLDLTQSEYTYTFS